MTLIRRHERVSTGLGITMWPHDAESAWGQSGLTPFGHDTHEVPAHCQHCLYFTKSVQNVFSESLNQSHHTHNAVHTYTPRFPTVQTIGLLCPCAARTIPVTAGLHGKESLEIPGMHCHSQVSQLLTQRDKPESSPWPLPSPRSLLEM